MFIAAADAGSLALGKAGNFGWSTLDRHSRTDGGTTPDLFAQRIGEALAAGERVALGFECPLSIPVRTDFTLLGKQRDGEAGRPWSAAAGAAVLATGLVQLTWVLRCMPGVGATVIPEQWSERTPILLWEAFVSGALKLDRSHRGHVVDAESAVRGFQAQSTPLQSSGDITFGGGTGVNLAVAAALAAGCDIDPSEICAPILVFKGA